MAALLPHCVLQQHLLEPAAMLAFLRFVLTCVPICLMTHPFKNRPAGCGETRLSQFAAVRISTPTGILVYSRTPMRVPCGPRNGCSRYHHQLSRVNNRTKWMSHQCVINESSAVLSVRLELLSSVMLTTVRNSELRHRRQPTIRPNLGLFWVSTTLLSRLGRTHTGPTHTAEYETGV